MTTPNFILTCHLYKPDTLRWDPVTNHLYSSHHWTMDWCWKWNVQPPGGGFTYRVIIKPTLYQSLDNPWKQRESMQLPKDGFHGIGAYIASIPAGKSRGLHSVQFCQAWRHYIESLPLVLKDKRSCFSWSEWSTVQLSLDCVFALQK